MKFYFEQSEFTSGRFQTIVIFHETRFYLKKSFNAKWNKFLRILFDSYKLISVHASILLDDTVGIKISFIQQK